MKQLLIIIFLILTVNIGCKTEKKSSPKKYISTLSLIKAQVAHVDTSLYSIIKIETRDSLKPDTTYIPREQFAEAAKDFLTIPDLSNPKIAKLYNEESLYDDAINRVTITYTPIDGKNEEVQKQEVSVLPDPSGDKIKSIYIDKEIINRDSSLKKIMFWETDKSFQITTLLQKPAMPETSITTKVIWSDKKE
ncbi:MAG: hypothetical protein JST23_00580 [Bacteroidetes bacterium]|nr:hypothetical protein [Bacteroidota bacterium]